jgi:hypothetical protein
MSLDAYVSNYGLFWEDDVVSYVKQRMKET